MEENNCFPDYIDQGVEVMILNFGKQESIYCLKMINKLRDNNISCELYPDNDKIKKQMNYANRKKVSFVIMIGEDEIRNNKISVKDMKSGNQNLTTMDEFISRII